MNSSASSSSPPHRIVILGGGVIGASTLYNLSLRLFPSSNTPSSPSSPSPPSSPVQITLIESVGIAHAASGKSGGFLAKDWQSGSSTGGLAETSFEMHREWASKLQGREKYGYRELETFAVETGPNNNNNNSNRNGTSVRSKLSWLNPAQITRARMIGTTLETAQVHPYYFTQTILSAAVQRNPAKTSVLFATATGFTFDPTDSKRITGVRISAFKGEKEAVDECLKHGYSADVVTEERSVEADVVVLCMGPWSGSVKAWLASETKFPKIDGWVF